MNVLELIRHMQQFPLDTEVIMWDCDGGADFPCTGSIYDNEHKTLELSTDLGDKDG